VWRFEWRIFHVGPSRVKLIFACQEVLKWVLPSITVIGCCLFKFKHYLWACTPSGKKPLMLYANNEWKIIGDQLLTKCLIELMDNSIGLKSLLSRCICIISVHKYFAGEVSAVPIWDEASGTSSFPFRLAGPWICIMRFLHFSDTCRVRVFEEIFVSNTTWDLYTMQEPSYLGKVP